MRINESMDGDIIKIIIIAGPTACGKTAVSLKVAESIKGEIIAADSMQVYRSLNIGTAKPSSEEINKIKHHLLDIIDPDEIYSAGAFADDARQAIRIINKKNKAPIICGGTGLYIKALTKGLAPDLPSALTEKIRLNLEKRDIDSLFKELKKVDPQTSQRISSNDIQRIKRALEVYHATGTPISEIQGKHQFSEADYDYLYFCLKRERKEIVSRIDERVDSMIDAGLFDEAEALIKRYKSKNISAYRAIGYKEMISHIKGEISLEEAANQIKKSTRDYAKRQMTWFRKQSEVIWVEIINDDIDKAAEFITEKSKIFLKDKN